MNKKILISILAFLFSFSFVSAVMVPVHSGTKSILEEEQWNVGGGYSLAVIQADVSAEPNQVWISFFKDGVKLDDAVVIEGGTYSYPDEDIFTTKIHAIFSGAVSKIVQFTDTVISSEFIGSEETPLMVLIGTPKKTLMIGEKWNVGGMYTLSVKSIDTTSTPRQAWIFLTENCLERDNKILSEGEVYSYHNSFGEEVFVTKLDSIFDGTDNDFVQFKNTYIKTLYSVVSNSINSEEWSCGEWSACIDSTQTRECTDAHNCGITLGQPEVIQECIQCTENWGCTEWSSCINGIQTRACNDLSICGTELQKPLTTKDCSACKEDWSCGEWTKCIDDMQTRECNDLSSCGTEIRLPETKQTCGIEKCEEKWSCGEWSACIDGEQTRTCEDLGKCRTFSQKPSLTKKCTEEKPKTFIKNNEAKAEKNSNNSFSLKVEDVSVESLSELMEESGKVFVVTSKGKNEIKILPSEALIKSNFTGKAEKISIEESFAGKAVYAVSGKKQGLFLFFLPVEAEIKVLVDVQTGEIVSTEKPWWAFLVWGF